MSSALDMFVANTFLFCLWWMGEFFIMMFDQELKAEIKGGYKWQGEQDDEVERKGLPTFKMRQKKVRHSPEWNDQLKGWLERKGQQKKVFGAHNRGRAYTFYFMYFCLATGNMWLCLTVSPQHYETPDNYGTLEYVGDLVRNFGKIRFDGFYDGLIISVVVLETTLFMLAAISVQWPKPALIRKSDLKHRPKEFFKNHTGPVSLLEDEQAGLINDCCLLIACHESCLTPERTETFSATLRAAMEVFPPRSIFVCDNGNSRHPVDRTLQVCKDVSREKSPDGSESIQYLYIPEGNKTHAMYWSTEYWIPELVRRGEIKDYTYAMIIDDDVPVPPDLHVPNNMLNRNTKVKAIAYVIQAATEDGSVNQLVQLQDLEYKMAGLVKQFQLKMGTTACCHGAIALWRRDVLGRRILWDHDTVFHGEDLYMGLLLHRMGQGYKIGVSAGAVVPTFAPEKLLILFRQRVKSWDLCAQRKFLSYLKELFFNWTRTTLVLKPFFFYEATSIVVDWTRPIMVAVLAHTNPVALLACFIFFYLILWLELVLFNYVILRRRADLRVPLRACLLFPFYKTMLQVFRTCALLENAMRYTTWTRKNVPIGTRERARCDLPPVPPHAHPPWADVWVPSTVEYGTQSGSSVGVGGGGGGAMPFRVVSNRELWGAGDNGVPPPHHHPHHLDAAMATTAGDGSECKSGDELSWGANSSATHQPPASGGDLAAPPAVQPTRPYTTLLRAYCNSICASSICEIPDAQHRGRFTFILEGYLLSAKLFEEDAALSFPRALATKQHDGAAESMMIRNLRDRIVHSLQSVLRQVADARCRAIMDAINGHLGDWNRRGRGLAVILSRPGVPPRAPANDAELCAVAVANMEALKEVGLALSLAKYPAHHDPLEQARRSVDELRALLGSVFEPYFARIAQQPRPSAPPM